MFMTEEHGIELIFIANEVLEDVHEYSRNMAIKRSVMQVIAPTIMKIAKYFFEWGYTKRGCQAVLRVYDEKVSYLDGVDKVPSFVTVLFGLFE